MQSTDTKGRRVALLPVEDRPAKGRPAIRRYRLARILDDFGAAVAAPAVRTALRAPAQGVRAP